MLIQVNDILLWGLWALLGLCIISPVMMLGSAYEASNVTHYHYRGHHLLQRRYCMLHVRLYAGLAAVSLLAVGTYLFLL
jgi:hypothetical protein